MRLAVSCRQDQLGGPQIMVPNGVTHQAGETIPSHPTTRRVSMAGGQGRSGGPLQLFNIAVEHGPLIDDL